MSTANQINHSEITFWGDVFKGLRALSGPVILISAAFWILPQLISHIAPTYTITQYVAKIQNFVSANKPGQGVDFANLISQLTPLAYQIFTWTTASWFLFIWGFFTLTLLFFDYFLKQDNGRLSNQLWRGFWYSLRCGIGLGLITVLLFILTQSIVPFLTFLIIPIMLAPAACIYERRGFISASIKVLTMNFGLQPKLPLFLQVCGIGAIFYLGHLLNSGLYIWIGSLNLELDVSREWLIIQIFGQPFSIPMLTGKIIEVLLRAALVATMIAASVCLYLRLTFLRLRQLF